MKESGDLPPLAWVETPSGDVWMTVGWGFQWGDRHRYEYKPELGPVSTENNLVRPGDKIIVHLGYAPWWLIWSHANIDDRQEILKPAGASEDIELTVPAGRSGPFRVTVTTLNWKHEQDGPRPDVISPDDYMPWHFDLFIAPPPVIDGDPPTFPDGLELVRSVGAPTPTAVAPP